MSITQKKLNELENEIETAKTNIGILLFEGDHEGAHGWQQDLYKGFARFLAENAEGRLGELAKEALEIEEWGIKPW